MVWPPEMGGAKTGKDGTDDALRALVLRAVSRDPTRRPESAAAFREVLYVDSRSAF